MLDYVKLKKNFNFWENSIWLQKITIVFYTFIEYHCVLLLLLHVVNVVAKSFHTPKTHTHTQILYIPFPNSEDFTKFYLWPLLHSAISPSKEKNLHLFPPPPLLPLKFSTKQVLFVLGDNRLKRIEHAHWPQAGYISCSTAVTRNEGYAARLSIRFFV